MKKYVSHIVSVLVVVVLLVSLFVPAFAVSPDYKQKSTFWHWAAGKWSPLNDIMGHSLGLVCPDSDDGYHHASSYYSSSQLDNGETVYKCVCTYCGHEFLAHESDLGQSYQEQVSALPAPGYSSSGELRWRLSVIKFEGTVDSVTSSDFVVGSVGTEWSVALKSGKSVYGRLSAFDAPVSGTYTGCIFSSAVSGVCFRTSNNCFLFNSAGYSLGISHVSNSLSYPPTGSLIKFDTPCSFVQGETIIPYYGRFHLDSTRGEFVPVVGYIEIICTPLVFLSDTYNINTRPTTITGGNYGIVGDDNNITTVTNTTQIVNEGDNLYYNPATGQTQTITAWSYNYDGRIYNITLDTGDKVSVEYGDENITITENTVNEGDTIVNNYTIYYMIDGSGESHTHEWYKTGERQATCLVPAQRTYTCSICGEQKTETDPVLGHSWHAIQTVTTQYDDDGNQTQEGYTIYECERCGEQYKSTNNTGPPPTGGGGSGGGTSENIFTGIFGLIWDFFTFLFDLFSEFVVGGIKGFIDGLKDAGSSFFSILNPFDWGY